MAQPDVLIVGAGVVGAACARALTARGVSVAILEAGPKPGAATPASAGMLAPLVEARPDDPLLSLNVRARDYYRDLAPRLLEESGIDIGLWMEGILHLAFTEPEADRLRDAIAWQRQLGHGAEWLEAEDLRRRCPGVSPAALGAALSLEDGALDPVALTEAFLKSAVARGARLTRGERADELTIDGNRVTALRSGVRTLPAGAVLLAAGCWSGRIQGLPRPLSVEPVRGQMASFAWPENEPPAIIYADHGYLLKRHSEVLAGTTMEHVGFDATVTDAGLAPVLAMTRRVYPSLDAAPVLRRWAGLRPGTPDGRPFVGRDREIENLWYATGHGRHGVLQAGLTGELIGALYAGEPVEHDISPVDPARFWSH